MLGFIFKVWGNSLSLLLNTKMFISYIFDVVRFKSVSDVLLHCSPVLKSKFIAYFCILLFNCHPVLLHCSLDAFHSHLFYHHCEI